LNLIIDEQTKSSDLIQSIQILNLIG